MHRIAASAVLLCFATFACGPAAAVDYRADVVILSGSEAGFTAAIQAARMGKTVVLIEPTGHPGGMAVEGIAGDIKHGNQQVIGGIAKEFYRNVAWHYQRSDPFSLIAWHPSYEPHAAEAVVRRMLSDHGDKITVLYGQRIQEGTAGVVKSGSRLQAIILEDGTRIAGRVFVDASIEGYLLHFVGVSTATGREDNAAYSESLNGIRAESPRHKFRLRIDPYVTPGDPASGLIETIQEGELGEPGAADPHVMGFCFRLCLTRNPTNVVPIERPADYDPADYEIYRRYLVAGGRLFAPQSRLPGGKTDVGSWHDLSANLYGENVGYPAGSYAEQDRIVAFHEQFTRGLIWFLQNDLAVPEATRRQWEGWGLCRDEFIDNGHWPRRLYIRSARRMKSDFVHTEHHLRWPNPERVADPVALAWWPPDMHHARRIVRDGAAYNEGFVYGNGGWSPFGIGYRALVPRRSQATNLLTPTCPSSSYVAYGAIRILSTFMMLGQATGTAACLAVDRDLDVQDVPYDALGDRLLADGLALAIPDGAEWDGKRPISYDGEAETAAGKPMRSPCKIGSNRCSGRFPITAIPDELTWEQAQLWTVARGDPKRPAAAWKLRLAEPAIVYLLVMDRGDYVPIKWDAVEGALAKWSTLDGTPFRDRVYRRMVEAEEIEIPAHTGDDGRGWYGIPNAAIVLPLGSPGGKALSESK